MKKSISLLTNLLTSSTLFWGVPTVESREVNLSIPAETTSYCHIKFPPISEDYSRVPRCLMKARATASISTVRAIVTRWEEKRSARRESCLCAGISRIVIETMSGNSGRSWSSPE